MTPGKSFNGLSASRMKHFLDSLADRYNNRSFISADPVSIPHRFTERHDIEISGLLTSAISWGRRDLILRSADRLMKMMDNEPHRFVISASAKEIDSIRHFVHRTFNGEDAVTFLHSIRNIYSNYGSIENVISADLNAGNDMKHAISRLHEIFFSGPHNKKCERHLPDISRGSAGKKLNMYLRWMVRKDDAGVDFGIWQSVSPSMLYIPLDLHAGNTARKLGLLTRKQNDWKAVEELTEVLRSFDPVDPVRYDFALFGAGVNNELNVK